MSACPNENRLLEYADGLLAEAEALSVAGHLDGCTSCRGAVAVLAREAEASVSVATPRPATAPLPEQLLRAYLERDAPEREADATRLIAIALLCGIGFIAAAIGIFGDGRPPPVPAVAPALLLGVLLWELGVHTAIHRGHYRPWLPLVDTLIEVSFPFVIGVVSVRAGIAAEAITTPWNVMVGAMVVFTAIRADPKLSIMAGALASLQQVVLWLIARESLAGVSLTAVQLPGMVVRAVVMLLAGAAGAMLATRFIRRATEALRDIREQDLFGKYLLHEKMGAGGMGEVYRATYCPEGGFVRNVAVKRLLPSLSSSERFVEALRGEARLSAGLMHPNLVQVLDCGTFRGTFILAMELIDGVSLSRLLRSRGAGLAPAAVAYLGAELSAALAYLQSRRGPDGRPLGLVHCDLNPPNVLISRIGEVKLADFGVARASAVQHRDGIFGGKPSYAAPEQLRAVRLDGRTDLFALGLTLFEAFAGRPAYSPGQTALASPRPSLAGFPGPLASLIERLLANESDARPANAAMVREELKAMTGACAPYPEGESLLSAAVEEVLALAAPRPASEAREASTVSPTTRALR